MSETKLKTNQAIQADAWSSWTPTIDNFTLGNGTVDAKYIQIGKTVHCRISVIFGSTSSISGRPYISLPVTSVDLSSYTAQTYFGIASFLDAATLQTNGLVFYHSTTQVEPRVMNCASTYSALTALDATTPWTWTTSDSFVCTFTYEAA